MPKRALSADGPGSDDAENAQPPAPRHVGRVARAEPRPVKGPITSVIWDNARLEKVMASTSDTAAAALKALYEDPGVELRTEKHATNSFTKLTRVGADGAQVEAAKVFRTLGQLFDYAQGRNFEKSTGVPNVYRSANNPLMFHGQIRIEGKTTTIGPATASKEEAEEAVAEKRAKLADEGKPAKVRTKHSRFAKVQRRVVGGVEKWRAFSDYYVFFVDPEDNADKRKKKTVSGPSHITEEEAAADVADVEARAQRREQEAAAAWAAEVAARGGGGAAAAAAAAPGADDEDGENEEGAGGAGP